MKVCISFQFPKRIIRILEKKTITILQQRIIASTESRNTDEDFSAVFRGVQSSC